MRKPNLLFIFADQFRRQSLGFMGETQVLTPHLDAFAEEGLVFDNAISSCPLCSPYRGCLFTGKYPLSHGVFTNCKPGFDIMLGEDEVCFSDVLHKKGYHKGYIGKWHLDEPEINHCEQPISGARGWDAYTPLGKKRHHFDFWYSYGTNDTHLTPHYWTDTPKQIMINQWSVEHETDIAIKYIEKHKNQPFALFIAYNPPHTPYDQVPQKYYNLYKNKAVSFRPNVRLEQIHSHTHEQFNYGKKELEDITRQYFAAITGIDENFARLMQALKQCDLEEDTIVVFTADHGDMLGAQHLMAKHVWYEESIGVPFVIRWENGGLKKGRTDVVLDTTDIMPTLLSLMKIASPKVVEGKDLSYIMTNEGRTGKDKVGFMCAFPAYLRGVSIEHTEMEKEFPQNPKDFGWRGIRTSEYTFIIDLGYSAENTVPKKFLYDLKQDPYQLHPIPYEDITYKEVSTKLETQLIEWLKQQKDGILQYKH